MVEVCAVFLLPLVASCLETKDVCIWRMFVFIYVVVSVWGVCGNVCCVSAIANDSVLALEC